jgi:hypothetical protein
MNAIRVGCAGRGLLVCSGLAAATVASNRAIAEPIRFLHRGVASGALLSLDGSSPRITFGPSSFTIDAIADTDNRRTLRLGGVGDGYGYDIQHASVTITIDGVGSFDLLVPTRTYVIHGDGDARVGFGMIGSIAPPDLFNGPMVSGLAGWDMTTSIAGEAAEGARVFQWDAAQVRTTGGRLMLDFQSSAAWQFEAVVVPVPGAVCVLAAFGVVTARRRR